MNDYTDKDTVSADQNVQKSNSPNSVDERQQTGAKKLIHSNLEVFVKLAESDLPIAEDAKKAITFSDGGEDS